MSTPCPNTIYEDWKREEIETGQHFAQLTDAIKMQDWDFNDKKASSSVMISKIYQDHNPVAAISGGRSSTVLIHLIDECIDGMVYAMFENTGVQYREQRENIENIRSNIDVEVLETSPKRSYGEVIKEFGPPTFGRQNHNELIEGAIPCCYYLKERPARDLIDEYGFDCTITGTQGSESYQRKWLAARCGLMYKITSGVWGGIWKANPVWHWRDQDLNQYLDENEVELPDRIRESRTGCWPCTAHPNWKDEVREKAPKLVPKLERLLGEAGRDEDQETLSKNEV